MAPKYAVLLVLLFASVAYARPITVLASDCPTVAAAFELLRGQFDNATTAAPLRLTLTFNCTADWQACRVDPDMRFDPQQPANSVRQPPVTITVNTNCKRGQNMSVPDPGNFLFTIDTRASNASVALTVVGTGASFDGSVISFKATPGIKNTLVARGFTAAGGDSGIVAEGLETVDISSATFKSLTFGPIQASGITKSVKITTSVWDGYTSPAIALDLPINTQVIATGNRFKAADLDSASTVQVTQAGGKININLGANTFDNSTSVPICITSPANVTKPVVQVVGSRGITPTRRNATLLPSGWPVTPSCSVASFRSV